MNAQRHGEVGVTKEAVVQQDRLFLQERKWDDVDWIFWQTKEMKVLLKIVTVELLLNFK